MKAVKCPSAPEVNRDDSEYVFEDLLEDTAVKGYMLNGQHDGLKKNIYEM